MEQTKANDILLAATSAYVWVASADAGVDLDEYKKFAHVILESPFATHWSEQIIRAHFKDMVNAFADNFDAAARLSKTRVQGLSNNSMVAEEIHRIARAALVGDQKITDAEEAVFGQICDLLGKKS